MRCPRPSWTLLAGVVIALLAPAVANAGTVTYSSTNVLHYTAAGGEANRLTIGVNGAGDRIVYTETGGVLISEAEADCDGNGTTVVSCKIVHDAMAPVFAAGATLGDMDDTGSASFPPGSDLQTSLNGEAGADMLDASGAAEGSVEGGDGTDRLTAARLRSFLVGGNQSDVLIGGPAGSTNTYGFLAADDGADDIQGGPGLDVLVYEERTAVLQLSADGTPDDGEAGEGDNISTAVEALEGGKGNDVLRASPVVDGSLSGYEGNDQLFGGPGDDVVFGGEGNDSMDGGAGDDLAASDDRGRLSIGGGPTSDAGADSFVGGPGFDTIDYTGRSAAVTASKNGQADDGEAGEGDNTGGDVERMLGGRGADTLAGDDDAEHILAGPGNDAISPGGGGDYVAAGEGDDTVGAQDGATDTISCGVGADTVTVDFADALDACEATTIGAPPLPPDTTGPGITITGLSSKPRFKQVAKGLRFKVGGDEPAAFVAELLGTARRATIARAYNLTLARKSFPLSAATRTVTLKPPRKLLGKRRKLKLRVRITATDAVGNVSVKRRTLRVRR